MFVEFPSFPKNLILIVYMSKHIFSELLIIITVIWVNLNLNWRKVSMGGGNSSLYKWLGSYKQNGKKNSRKFIDEILKTSPPEPPGLISTLVDTNLSQVKKILICSIFQVEGGVANCLYNHNFAQVCLLLGIFYQVSNVVHGLIVIHHFLKFFCIHIGKVFENVFWLL